MNVIEANHPDPWRNHVATAARATVTPPYLQNRMTSSANGRQRHTVPAKVVLHTQQLPATSLATEPTAPPTAPLSAVVMLPAVKLRRTAAEQVKSSRCAARYVCRSSPYAPRGSPQREAALYSHVSNVPLSRHVASARDDVAKNRQLGVHRPDFLQFSIALVRMTGGRSLQSWRQRPS